MTHDWTDLYSDNNLTKWRLPEAAELNAEYGEFRAPRLVWSDIAKALKATRKLAVALICCDVLHLDETATLDDNVVIFARCIEVSSGVWITVNRVKNADKTVVITAQKIVDQATGQDATLKMSCMSFDDNRKLIQTDTMIAADDVKAATTFALRPGQLTAAAELPAQAALGFLPQGQPLPVMLTTIFQIACLLSTTSPRIAVDQVMWIAALTARDPASRAISADCHALHQTLLQIMEIDSDALLVPQLDHKIYADKSKACLAMLTQRSARYEALVARIDADDRWRDDVAITIEDKKNEVALAASLRAQSETTCDQMREARRIAATNLLECRDSLPKLMVTLERSIKTWERDETIKASFEILKSTVDLMQQAGTIAASGGTLAAVPVAQSLKMVAGLSVDLTQKVATEIADNDADWLFDDDSEGGTFEMSNMGDDRSTIEYLEDRRTEKKAAKDEAKRQKKLKDSASDLRKAGIAAGKDVMGIYDGVMKIVAIAGKARKLEGQSEDLLLKAMMQVNTAFGSIEPVGLEMVTGGEDAWTQTALGLEDMFHKMGDMLDKLGGGSDYRLALRRLVAYGNTMSQARLALAKANGDLADAMLREQSAVQATKLYERHLNDLNTSRARDTALRQLAFGRVLDSKRSVYLAMEAFMRAVSYFTLQPFDRSKLPQITESVDAFAESVTRNTGTWVVDMALGTPPTDLNMVIDLDVNDADVARNEDGSISWIIPTTYPRFNRLQRVRIASIRAFAQGVETDGDLWIDIKNDGMYRDKAAQGETPSFVTQPYARSLVYNPNDPDSVTVDSSLAGRFKEDFFKPTPFTTWRFAVSRQDGKELDLSTLTGMKIHINGNVVSGG